MLSEQKLLAINHIDKKLIANFIGLNVLEQMLSGQMLLEHILYHLSCHWLKWHWIYHYKNLLGQKSY
jgi:hypothetical protein